LTGAGVTHLIRGCRRLEVLELQNAKRIQKEDFLAILNMLAAAATDENSMFALRKIVLTNYPFFIRENPFAVVDHIADVDTNAQNGMDEALVNDE
jgi:hypothetical protein